MASYLNYETLSKFFYAKSYYGECWYEMVKTNAEFKYGRQ